MKEKQKMEKGFVEEILDMQGVEYKSYLEGTSVDEVPPTEQTVLQADKYAEKEAV
jgi:hypothetical protein